MRASCPAEQDRVSLAEPDLALRDTSPRGRTLVFYHIPLLNSDTMKVVKTVIILLIALTAMITATLFLVGHFKEKPAGVFINTSPISDVYINGSLVGKTLYTSTHKAGEIALKLVPGSTSQNLIAYETI